VSGEGGWGAAPTGRREFFSQKQAIENKILGKEKKGKSGPKINLWLSGGNQKLKVRREMLLSYQEEKGYP